MIHPVALFSGFSLVLATALLSEGPLRDGHRSLTPEQDAAPTTSEPMAGRIAYLSAPMLVPHNLLNDPTRAPAGEEQGTGWQVIFAGNRHETEAGSHEALLEAVRMGRPIAVGIPTFHGTVIAPCLEAYETTENDVGCEVEFWCDGPSQAMIPARHKHIAVVRSNGEVQQAVAVHNERDEERIVQMGYFADSLTWYTE